MDFENVETGEIITNDPGRKPQDTFHSRLEVSPNGIFLMSKGWFWHPLDVVNVFNLSECFESPNLLEQSKLYPDVGVEVSTASFINDQKVIIGSSDEIFDEDNLSALPPKHLAVWDLETNQISKPTSINIEFGNLFAINEFLTWDLYDFPKIININTGDVIEKEEGINSGQQRSSIMHYLKSVPQIIFNPETKQIAISGDGKIEVLTP